MCALTAGRFIESFTNAAECQASGPKFDQKNSKCRLVAAERAEKMLSLNRSERIKTLDVIPKGQLYPEVCISPLSQKHLSAIPATANEYEIDVSMSDVEPDSDAHTESEIVALSDKESEKTVSAGDSAPMQTDAGKKKQSMKQLKKTDKNKPSGKRKCFDKNGNVIVGRRSDNQGDMDKPPTAAGVVSGFATNQAEQSTERSRTLTVKKNSSVKAGKANVLRDDRSTDKPLTDNVNDLPVMAASVASAKNPKKPESVAGKKKSSKSGDVNTVGKNDDTGSVEKLKGVAGNVNASQANLTNAEMLKVMANHSSSNDCNATDGMNRKRKASEHDKANTEKQVAEHSSQLSVEGRASQEGILAFTQEDLNSSSPNKSQKVQQCASGESEAVAVDRGDPQQVQQMISSTPRGRGIRQRGRGRPPSHGHYADISKAVLPAEHAQHVVPNSGFLMLTGCGRGRPRGSGRAGVTGVQSVGRVAGSYHPSDSPSAYGVGQRGMPIRGRGRAHVVGSPPHHDPESVLVRNGAFSSGDMSSVRHQPQVLMNDASDMNSQFLRPVSDSASEYHTVSHYATLLVYTLL